MADDLIKRLTERADMAEMAVARLIGERDALRAEVERLELIIETCDIGLFDTFVKTKERAEKAEAEVARLTEVSEAWQRGFAERGAQLERLTAEVEALRADKERLDWLEDEARCGWVTLSSPNSIIVYSGRGKALREGVDAARSAT